MMRGFEALVSGVKLPQRATSKSAGYDFYLPDEVIIKAHSQVLIKTNIRAYMNEDEYLAISIRSSLGIKKGLKLVNQTGIIDADYYNNPDNLGNIIVAIENTSDVEVKLEKGQAFVQGIFMKYLVVDDDNVTTLRTGGIGSSSR